MGAVTAPHLPRLLLAVTVWVWLPLLVLGLSNLVLGCCGASNEATVKKGVGAFYFLFWCVGPWS